MAIDSHASIQKVSFLFMSSWASLIKDGGKDDEMTLIS